MNDLHVHELKAFAAEQLREAQQLRVKMTELSSTMMALGLNGVLETAIGVLDGSGVYGRDFRAPYAAIAIVNNSNALITVTNSPLASQAPTSGAGAWEVLAGKAVVMNLLGTHVTFYGVAAGRFSYTVFSRPQPPSFG